jgi:fumarate reductase flavoprotein subunit
MVNTLYNLIKDCNRVKVLFNTKAIKILENTIEYINLVSNQTEILCNLNAIIVATGGYGFNDELLNKYAPQITNHSTTNGPFTTGDGLYLFTL